MKCRIGSIVPERGYRAEGVSDIWLLDWEDFKGVDFKNDGLYNVCLVSIINRDSDFSCLDASVSAKYNSGLQGKVYTHVLETFVGDLSADILSEINLSTKRRYIVAFRSHSGRYFIFGLKSGSTVKCSSQTSDGFGTLITLTENSIFPLFELESLYAIKGYLKTSLDTINFDAEGGEIEITIKSNLEWEVK